MLNNFFINTKYIGAEVLDIGFDLYSAPHLIWLALMAVLAVWMCRIYAGKNEEKRVHMKKVAARLARGLVVISNPGVLRHHSNPGVLRHHSNSGMLRHYGNSGVLRHYI